MLVPVIGNYALCCWILGIMGMIGKLLLELEYCPQNNRANAKAKPLGTFFTGLMHLLNQEY